MVHQSVASVSLGSTLLHQPADIERDRVDFQLGQVLGDRMHDCVVIGAGTVLEGHQLFDDVMPVLSGQTRQVLVPGGELAMAVGAGWDLRVFVALVVNVGTDRLQGAFRCPHPVLFGRVLENKRKNPSVRIVDIATRRTPTSEYADLFTSLARAANWPTRTVFGMAYSDTPQPAT